MGYSPLLTDLYQLTMLAGYLEEGMTDTPASFDLYFRRNPFGGGYAVFAGLEPALEYLEGLRFGADDLSYLHSLGIFPPRFLDFLAEFRFRGTVTAPPEGTAVFAGAPLVTVDGTLAETQFVETALLNIINFQTLVATKAARIREAAAGGAVLEFGLRRAQGPDGALSVARAACVGGVRATSNVLAGQVHGLRLRGTHAHSWIMAFPDELSAFRAYARTFPDTTVLLVDTYDTLGSGVPHAITVARELRARGHELAGIRIDSGDLAYLSRRARQLLDDAGFPEVRIVVSNDLDEHLIEAIRSEGGRADLYGVGTRLAVCAGDGGGALGGVYKLVESAGRPRMKLTGEPEKATLPGRKRLLRATAADGSFIQDVICRADETVRPGDTVYDPATPLRHVQLPDDARLEELRAVVMAGGARVTAPPSLDTLADRCADQLRRLPWGCLRLVNPHRYKVSVSAGLDSLRAGLTAELEQANLAAHGGTRGWHGPPPDDAALVIVDLQNDFCPGGALAVREGDAVVPLVNRYAALFARRGLPVLASRDWHPPVTSHFRESGGIWPPHCVRDTPGAEFHPDLRLPAGTAVLSKGTDHSHDDYSAFHARDDAGRSLADLLADRGVKRLFICGLATDYCVRETVLESLRRGLETVVLSDAVRSVDLAAGDGARALDEMRTAGARPAVLADLEQ